jgi:hypothetical protein
MSDKAITKRQQQEAKRQQKYNEAQVIIQQLETGTYTNTTKKVPETAKKALEEINQKKQELIEKYSELNIAPRDAKIVAEYLKHQEKLTDPKIIEKKKKEEEAIRIWREQSNKLRTELGLKPISKSGRKPSPTKETNSVKKPVKKITNQPPKKIALLKSVPNKKTSNLINTQNKIRNELSNKNPPNKKTNGTIQKSILQKPKLVKIPPTKYEETDAEYVSDANIREMLDEQEEPEDENTEDYQEEEPEPEFEEEEQEE